MEALRLIVEPVNYQLVIDLPPSLSSRWLERLARASTDQLEIWGERVLETVTLAEVFGEWEH